MTFLRHVRISLPLQQLPGCHPCLLWQQCGEERKCHQQAVRWPGHPASLHLGPSLPKVCLSILTEPPPLARPTVMPVSTPNIPFSVSINLLGGQLLSCLHACSTAINGSLLLNNKNKLLSSWTCHNPVSSPHFLWHTAPFVAGSPPSTRCSSYSFRLASPSALRLIAQALGVQLHEGKDVSQETYSRKFAWLWFCVRVCV